VVLSASMHKQPLHVKQPVYNVLAAATVPQSQHAACLSAYCNRACMLLLLTFLLNTALPVCPLHVLFMAPHPASVLSHSSSSR
jgi:Fe2+ transport system protein B